MEDGFREADDVRASLRSKQPLNSDMIYGSSRCKRGGIPSQQAGAVLTALEGGFGGRRGGRGKRYDLLLRHLAWRAGMV
jgi:hypothetical protein